MELIYAHSNHSKSNINANVGQDSNIAVMLINDSIPLAVTDYLWPLMKECFKDSATAQEYKCARAKTFCIMNKAVAPHFKNTLVMQIRERPYTFTHGSNETGTVGRKCLCTLVSIE